MLIGRRRCGNMRPLFQVVERCNQNLAPTPSTFDPRKALAIGRDRDLPQRVASVVARRLRVLRMQDNKRARNQNCGDECTECLTD
jgi:hypothetical protein